MTPCPLFPLVVGQWNIRSVRPHQIYLQYWLREKALKVLCLQETWLEPHLAYSLSNFQIFRSDRPSRGGGVLIAVHTSIPVAPFQVPLLQPDLDCVAVQLRFGDVSLYVINVYCPPGRLTVLDCQTLFNLCSPNTILCGDFNAHHASWDTCAPNRAGVAIATQLTSYPAIHLLNDGTSTMATVASHSAPDLTFAALDSAFSARWYVDPELISDHLPIRVELSPSVGGSVPSQQFTRWNYAKADWPLFANLLDKQAWPEVVDVEEASTYLTESILAAASQAIPCLSAARRQSSRVPWWTEDCRTAYQARDHQRRIFARRPTMANHIHLKRSQAQMQRTFRQAYEDSWHTYCAQLRTTTPHASIWRYCRKMQGHRAGIRTYPLTDALGNLLSAQAQTEAFTNHFAQLALEVGPPFMVHPGPPDPKVEGPFTMSELTVHLDSLANPAPGPDGITQAMIRHLPAAARAFLLSIFNAGWSDARIPCSWKTGFVLPILKPGKTPASPVSYRPITLLPLFGKIWERLVLPRLTWVLQKRRWWSDAQHGGLRGLSAAGALTKIINAVKCAMANKQVAAYMFLDIQQAYDTLPTAVIMAMLSAAHLPPTLSRWLVNFLMERGANVKLPFAISEEFPVLRGIPQGAVLSAVLYVLSTNDFKSEVEALFHTQYIDDLGAGTLGSSPRDAILKLRRTAGSLERWANNKGLSFNANKSSIVLFSAKALRLPLPQVALQGEFVPLRTSVRVLGVTLDRQLSWRIHINNMVQHITKTYNLLRALGAYHWGAQRETLRTAYKALVWGYLMYSAPLIYNASPLLLTKLQRTLNKCLRHILACPLSTNIQAMHVEANLMPLSLFLEQQAVLTGYKLYLMYTKEQLYDLSDHIPDTVHWPRGRPLSFLLAHSGVSPRSPISLRRPATPRWPPWEVPTPTVYTDIPFIKGDQTAFNESLLEQWLDDPMPAFVIYTDASRHQDGYTATGFWAPEQDFAFGVQLPDFTSVYYAEAFGIFLALRWILLSTSRPSSVVIVTDALSVLQHLQSQHQFAMWSIGAPLADLFYDLHLRGCSVSLLWVPSHSNICHNDAIDTFVNTIRPLPWCAAPLPLALYLSSVKLGFRQQWQRTWNLQYTHLSSIRPALQQRCHIQCNLKLNTTTLTAARLGRLRTHALLARWDASHDPHCPFCPGELHTTRHILLYCARSGPEIHALLPRHVRALPADQRYRLLQGVLLPGYSLDTVIYDHIALILRQSLP